MMKKFCLLVVVASLALGFAARADLVTGVSVVVEDQVITYGEVAEKVARTASGLVNIYGSDRAQFEAEIRRLHSQEVEDLVERKLILHEFYSAGYVTNALETFVENEVNRDIKRNYGGDRARLIETLKAEGRTLDMYRRDIRDGAIIYWMRTQNEDESKKIIISPLKIEKFYKDNQEQFKVDDEVQLRMISISQAADGQPGSAKKLADEVLGKINGGVPFAEMATTYSSDSYKKKGGERGWVERKDLKEELAQAAFALKPGEHSGVVELPEGCYIMLVEDKRSAHVRALPEVRAEIEATLIGKAKSNLHERWIKRLKTKSFIQYY
jgi:peptidyl-prolyl cis-trans isomerase SurA